MTTTARIDTERRALGLSLAEFAEVTGVSDRVARYWFSGGSEPRDCGAIMARLGEVRVAMGDLVETLAEGHHERFDREGGDRFAAIERYRSQVDLNASRKVFGLPAGAHAMAMSWLADDLEADGFLVEFEWHG